MHASYVGFFPYTKPFTNMDQQIVTYLVSIAHRNGSIV